MSRGIVETKVIASTLATACAGIVVAVLNDVRGNSELLGSLPPVVQTVILIVAPALVSFLAGWTARHTSRPEL